MPRLIDLVSKWIITPAVQASPELKELIRQRADETTKQHLLEAEVMTKLQGQPLGWALPATQLQGARVGQSGTKPGTGVSFALLRELSTYYWCARACINKRQEQIHNLTWEIVSTDPESHDKPSEEAVKAIKDFLKQIAGPNNGFRQFLDMVIDDLLTLDGAAIFKAKTGKRLKFLWPVDASTIRIRVDQAGMLPEPPENAYEQWVRGKLVAEMTTDEMAYLMMNARTSTPYGLSPLESLVLIVNAALKSEVSNLAMLGEGNVPEGLIQLPQEWTTDQIKQFQEYWDGVLAGNLAQQRRIKFIPGGNGLNYIPTKKPADMEFGEMEKWLATKTCAMFGVSPQAIGLTFDINKATAGEQATLAKNESIRPLANLLEEFFNHLIQEDLGFTDLKFCFMNMDTRDERSDAEVNTKYLSSGVYSINEVRSKIGEDPIEGGDERFILTPGGPVPIEPVEAPEEPEIPAPAPEKPVEPEKPAPADKAVDPLSELKAWRRVALKDLASHRPFRKFQSDALDVVTLSAIDTDLQACKTPLEVRDVFRKHIALSHDRALDAAGVLLAELETILKSDGPKPTVEVQ